MERVKGIEPANGSGGANVEAVPREGSRSEKVRTVFLAGRSECPAGCRTQQAGSLCHPGSGAARGRGRFERGETCRVLRGQSPRRKAVFRRRVTLAQQACDRTPKLKRMFHAEQILV